MKIVLAIALIGLTAPAAAATYNPTDAAKHVGEKATVEGTASVYASQGGTTFIDLGGSGRDAPFTGVIFKDNIVKFPSITALSGQVVDITGQIREYRGKPEIILNSPDQVRRK